MGVQSYRFGDTMRFSEIFYNDKKRHCTYLELLFELTFESSVGHQNLMLWRRRPDQLTTNQPHKVLTRTTIKAEWVITKPWNWALTYVGPFLTTARLYYFAFGSINRYRWSFKALVFSVSSMYALVSIGSRSFNL